MITYNYIDIVLYIVSYIITYYVHTYIYIYIYRSIFIHSLINRSCHCVVSRIRVGPRGNPVALGQGVECPQKGIKKKQPKSEKKQPKSARDVTRSACLFSNEPTLPAKESKHWTRPLGKPGNTKLPASSPDSRITVQLSVGGDVSSLSSDLCWATFDDP